MNNEMLEKQLEKAMEKLDKIDEKMLKGAERITSLESSYRSIHKRMDSREEELKAIHQIASSLEHLSNTMKETVNKVDCHEKQLINLEHRPAKTALKYLEDVFVYLLMAVIGYFIAQVL